MATFSCQCQSYRGNLVATEKEFYFTSSLFRVDMEWSNVKHIRLETQQVKGVPTSVLVVVLQHNEAVRLQATSPSAQKRRGSSARKYFFFGFQDLLGAEEQVKHYLELYRATEKAKRDDARDDSEKNSSTTTRQAQDKAVDKDNVSSSASDAPKEESLTNSRAAAGRKLESDQRRTQLTLSFAGRRAPALTSSRPRLAGRPLAITPAPADAQQSGKVARAFLRVYRHLAALLIILMVGLLMRHYTRFSALQPQQPFHAAERLLLDVRALAETNAQLESYDSQESLWRYNKERKELVEVSRTYTRQLEEAAVELMRRYVALQAKMATLRGHRAQRVEREQQSGTPPPPPPLSMASEYSTPTQAAEGVRLFARRGGAPQADDAAAARSSATDPCASGSGAGGRAACRKPTTRKAATSKRMSLLRLRADVRRWARRARAAWGYATHLVSARPAAEPVQQAAAPAEAPHHGDADWVVYSENLGARFRLTEWVSAAEEADRKTCRQLTQELLETLAVTERVFATFSRVFLSGRYRQLEAGEERASHWMQPPQALRTVTGGQKYYAARSFSGEEVARFAMLRRFVASLVYGEPLEAGQARRRAAALHVADSLLRHRQAEVQLLRARNQGSPGNTTALWEVLEELVLKPAAAPLRGNPDVDESTAVLRNVVAELNFWHTHESAWRAHVLTFFTAEEQAEIRGTFDDDGAARAHRSLVDMDTQTAALRWDNLPLFRGLLCFHAVPRLSGGSGEDVLETAEGSEEAAAGTPAESSEGVEEEQETAQKGEKASDEADSAEGNAAAPTSGESRRGTAASAKAEGPRVLPAPPVAAASVHNATSAAPRSPPTTPSTPVSPPPVSSSKAAELWKDVKLRWMADLDVFRLAFDARLAGRTGKAARSYRMDEESYSVVADAAEVRRRLFGLLTVVDEHYVRYLTPTTLQRFGSFLRALFPPCFTAHSGKDEYIAALRGWGTQDPAVQLATAQVTSFAPGTTSDVSRSLLYLVLQPPPLLQTSVVSTRQTTAAVVVLVLFVGVLAALYMMH